MTTQPEALRLAEWLEGDGGGLTTLGDCAAELRRLHQFAEDQIGRTTAAEAALQMTKTTHALKLAVVEAQRDALLEALGKMVAVYSGQVQNDGGYTVLDSARPLITDQAAIKAVEENT